MLTMQVDMAGAEMDTELAPKARTYPSTNAVQSM
jgi:hypothetical protein